MVEKNKLMNTDRYKIVLALLLINKGDPFDNSYKLTRILEWKFRIIHSKEVLDDMKKRGYVIYYILKGIHYYKLTESGRQVIEQEYDSALESLLQAYPDQINIIDSLFKSFDLQ